MVAEPVIREPIYLGEYDHGLDDKRRLQIPAKWRPIGATEGYEYMVLHWKPRNQAVPCLLVLPGNSRQRLVETVSSLPFGDGKSDSLRRNLTCDAEMVSLDSAGRICLPHRLAEMAQIRRRVMLVGLLDRFQLLNPENFALVRTADQAQSDDTITLI